MKLINYFSEEDIRLLRDINIIISEADYSIDQIEELKTRIEKDGFYNMNITYAEAEKYHKLHEKLKVLDKIDIEKVKKYSKEEFDNDNYLLTPLLDNMLWSNPNRINTALKSRNEKLLTEEDYKKYEERYKNASERHSKYLQFMEEKYGKDLDAVEKYYSNS